MLTLATVGAQAGPFLFDLLAIQSFRRAWDEMLGAQHNVPPWIVRFGQADADFATPSTEIDAGDGRSYIALMICRPTDCSDTLFVIIDPGGKQAWGLLETDPGLPTGHHTFLGHPDASARAALIQIQRASIGEGQKK